ncbi:RHS repeat-associated core domain-containing protein [Pseudomonas sp. NFACC08-1]|uniref:RHS repeat-associated core domain-containing protein n=1 Tax=Pseudomonas sp. NFACC08-1 TaxID=1566238 RepID=UPI000896AF0C|nr:RHS repeat-associated core domain-containing protein [Pseudomonas sp. NFACC08-1]SDY25464.1 RHS repeat-associated core domain-containing protein [Pseudomonas sp. NFACC08-1]
MADSDLGSNHPITNFAASPYEPTTRFHYDALDSLIGRTTSEGKEHRFYRNDELASEVSGTVSTTFVRAEGVVLAECQTGGDASPILLMGDDKNSVMGEVTRQGLTSIAYSPYGHRVEGSSASSHLGYNGERRERQTGWYLLGKGYRVFNPQLMRFHSPDNLSPFGRGGLNAYMYCVGDPINNVDPTGHGFIGAVSRFFRKPAAFSVGETTSGIFTLTKHRVKPPSLRVIGSEDVLNAQKNVAYFDVMVRKYEAKFIEISDLEVSPEIVSNMISEQDFFRGKTISALKNYEFALRHKGEVGITRRGAKKLEALAEVYDKMMKNIPGQERAEHLASVEDRVRTAAEMKNIRE